MSLRDYGEFGQLVQRLHRVIIQGNISHAYIIEGDACIDKTGFVQNVIKAVLCQQDPGFGCDHCVTCQKIDHHNYEDLYHVTGDDSSLKDAVIAELQEKLKTKPSGGMRNIAIIEDADTMTVRAQNRLLKTLEEPNPGTIIFLLSENTENLLPTITSRCITYRLSNFMSDGNAVDLTFAREIMDMLIEDTYFCDLKDKLSKGVKDKKDAFLLLDGLERLSRACQVGESDVHYRKERIIEQVNYIEEARRDLLANVNYKYAIRNLILKLGG